CTANWAWFAYW
nr:immunoglobulin heavy chain junction region [Mus musculus]NSM03776.1 immunoglobulin heavy chain junction region [Mus musculus]NSM03906.1 immunoglobulin heavy chain junction region [Mus musculus]NSM03913.1 immunoglobulin heavy chain junction region [Mus musculus]NSM03942.1 immunoglobulin heavy chain junction region [Mus musculus]